MEPEENQNIAPEPNKLNEELLNAAQPQETVEKAPPKKNTKQALLEKILEVSERDGLPLEHTNSKLKRMSKAELTNVLAELIEEGMRRKMAQKVGCDPLSDNRTIALGALRMLHDICAMGVEKGGGAFLEPKGYQIEGFTESLKEPTVSEVIDGCLLEIAEENNEILEYVQSPYARLGIAWAGALAYSVKKKPKNVTFVEPGPPRIQNPIRRRMRRGAPPGKVNNNVPPLEDDEKQV